MSPLLIFVFALIGVLFWRQLLALVLASLVILVVLGFVYVLQLSGALTT